MILSIVFPLPQEEMLFIFPISRVLTFSLQSICLTEVTYSSWWAKNFNSTRFHHCAKVFLKFMTAEAIVSRSVEPYGVGKSVILYPRPCATHAGLALFYI